MKKLIILNKQIQLEEKITSNKTQQKNYNSKNKQK